jgi:hypothetical protein
MRGPVSRGMRYAPNVRRAQSTRKGDRQCRRLALCGRVEKRIFKGQLTIGVDLGARSSCYCVLDKNGENILEQKVTTTPEAVKQAFGKMPRCRIAMETGTHSPWVSRVLTELGHEVIVAHALMVLYFAFPLTRGRQTVRYFIVGLKVAPPFGNEGRFTFKASLLRTFYAFVGLASVLTRNWDRDGQGRTWYDRKTDCTVCIVNDD